MSLPVIARVSAGTPVFILIRTREIRNDSLNGQLVAANGANVDITGPTGSSVVDNGSVTFRQTGELLYTFNTTGLAPGTYKVTVNGSLNLGDAIRALKEGLVVITG